MLQASHPMMDMVLNCLENQEIKVLKKNNQLVAFLDKNDEFKHIYAISFLDKGNFFIAEMVLVDENTEKVSMKDSENRVVVFEYLLLLNYETMFGSWEYSEEKEHIRFRIEIPLIGALMTTEQVQYILYYMLRKCSKLANKILYVREEGVFPDGAEDISDFIKKLSLKSKLTALKNERKKQLSSYVATKSKEADVLYELKEFEDQNVIDLDKLEI